MAKHIEKLILKSFRGSSKSAEIVFDVTKPVTLIFGENGTGKTTIVDGIDFVCNGSIGSLEFRNLGKGQKRDPFLKSLGKQNTDLAVEIQADGTTWKAALSTAGPVLCKTPNRPKAWVLRRESLLAFVNEEPAKRYEQLASYISISEVEVSEGTLRETVKNLERTLTASLQATTQAEESLKGFWAAEGSPGKSYEEWAKVEAARTTDQLTNAVNTLEPIVRNFDLAKQQVETVKTATAAVAVAEVAVGTAQMAFDGAANKSASGAPALVEVLTKAQAFLTQNQNEKDCPICERDIDAKQTAEKIGEKLKTFKELGNAKTVLDGKVAAVVRAAETNKQAIRSLNALIRLCAIEVKTEPRLTSISKSLEWASYPDLLNSGESVDSPSVAAEASNFLTSMQGMEAPIRAQLVAEKKRLNQLNAVQLHYSTLTTKRSALATNNELFERAKRLLVIVEGRRKAFVDELLAEVSQEIEKLYQQIHPNESIGGLKLYLSQTQKGSLFFEGKFEQEAAVPPQAYYSESHLDTLGICIFLALVRKLGGGNSFVVLDDLFTSVDQEHLRKIVKLIHDEAANYGHLVITTHFATLRDSYRFNRAPGHQVQLIELLPWSMVSGIRHTKTKLSVEELKNALLAEPLNKQEVASKAGILLEGLFDHLTSMYHCNMPRKDDGRYTLGEFFDACAKLKKSLKSIAHSDVADTPAVESLLTDKIDELANVTWMRNEVGAHFNLAAGLSSADIKDFGQKTCELAEMVICTECGELPRIKSQGTHWKCRCDKRHLYPLERP